MATFTGNPFGETLRNPHARTHAYAGRENVKEEVAVVSKVEPGSLSDDEPLKKVSPGTNHSENSNSGPKRRSSYSQIRSQQAKKTGESNGNTPKTPTSKENGGRAGQKKVTEEKPKEEERVEEEEVVNPDKWCPVCGEAYEDETPYMVQCERCRVWTHGKCVGIDRTKYRRLQTPEADPFEFFCPECSKGNPTHQRKSKALLLFADADKAKIDNYMTLKENKKGKPKGKKRNGKTSPQPPSPTNDSPSPSRGNGRENNNSVSGNDSRAATQDTLLVKPPDAYMLFKYALSSANPLLEDSILQLLALREWMAMGKGDKRKYFSEADRLMTRYRVDLAAFQSNDKEPRRKKQRVE